MARRDIRGVPVVDEAGAIAGMKQAHWLDVLAESVDFAPDFVEAICNEQDKVTAVVSRGVIAVHEDTPAYEIASLMTRPDATPPARGLSNHDFLPLGYAKECQSAQDPAKGESPCLESLAPALVVARS